MLSLILDVHLSKPLTDQEMYGYTRPNNVPDREGFINRFLNPYTRTFHE
tara:strand:- start:393 stop:539 length:147 start_codon:yes stop_codon:yes gene_type:complete